MQPLEGRQQLPSQVVTKNRQQDMLDAQRGLGVYNHGLVLFLAPGHQS